MKRIASPRLVSAVAFALLAAVLLATPLAAHAQAAEDIWAAVSVELYDLEEEMEPTLVITGRIPDEVELPVDAAIAIPKDVSVAWMGQAVPDTNPDTWPQIIDAELIEGDEYNVVTFVLDEAPAVQLELQVPEGWVTDNGSTKVVDAEYIMGGSSEAARIGVSTTHDYMFVDGDPEPKVDVRQTDIFYSVETSPAAEGDVLRISGTVAQGEAPELTELEKMMEEQQAAAEESAAAATEEPIEIDTGFSISPTTLILAALGIGIAIVIFLIYRTMTASSEEEDEEEADDEGAAGDDGAADDEAEPTTEAADDDADWGEIDDDE